MELNKNIRKLIDLLGITPYEFSKQIGNKRADNIYNVINEKVEVSTTTINKILKRYPVYKSLVLFGDVEATNTDAIIARASTANDDSKVVCLYDVSASVGHGSFDEIIKHERVVGTYVVPAFKDISWMIFVKGSSMYPKYSSGDIIACRVIYESQFIQWGKVYAVATKEQGVLVKRLEKSEKDDCYLAVSDNPAYKPFNLPRDEIVGIALVVGVIRME